MTSLQNNNEYINTAEYSKLENKLTELKSILEDLTDKSIASRRLRFAEVDIEVEREAGRVQPDELYIPVHTIDTNIRREQSAYIQYLVQSPRAVITKDKFDPATDMSLLDIDLTNKLRYDGWQMPMFANVDGFQANGYGVMEIVQDLTNPGEVGFEQVQLENFAFVADTRDIQAAELLGRTYHFTKTKLLALCGDPLNPKDGDWDREQVEKVVSTDSQASTAEPLESADDKDKSLYRVQKVQYRINSIVNVGWACIGVADDWLRKPRPLYLGRRQLSQQNVIQQGLSRLTGQIPPSENVYEKEYPYVVFQYLISENDTISHLKGRIFLDQDVQEGVASLLSSTCTQARRAAGMYFSEDTDDPNADLLMDKNVYFKPGCLIPKKVQAFKIDAPDPGIFSAIQILVSGNQQETSQVNFAESNNQRDSRKTAAAIKESQAQRQTLTTIQVVLFSLALRQLYQKACEIIKSRVICGLIKVKPELMPLYQKEFYVKPSGDVDVIEKQQLLQMMQQAWPVMQQTPAASLFLCDMIEKSFPDSAARYIQVIQQAQQQQQSAQAQQQQQMMQFAQDVGKRIIELSKHTDWFSDVGKLHAVPIIEQYANQIEHMAEQMKQQQKQQAQMVQHK